MLSTNPFPAYVIPTKQAHIYVMNKIKKKVNKFLHEVSQEEGGEYYNLAVCIRSGQVSARQIQEHLKDKDFKDYYMNNFFGEGDTI